MEGTGDVETKACLSSRQGSHSGGSVNWAEYIAR